MFSFRISFLVVVASLVFGATYVPAQIASDPTKDSDLIQKTMSKIQDVEKLDQYIQQNEELKKANNELKAEIASIRAVRSASSVVPVSARRFSSRS